MTPAQLASALAGLDLDAVARAELARRADALAQEIRGTLSHPPGSTHETPWLRTGTLRDSIAASVDQDDAVIGSTDPVAVFQEYGTAAIPPRPFLAPAAAVAGESIAHAIAAAVAKALGAI
jgi:hypothetical protein